MQGRSAPKVPEHNAVRGTRGESQGARGKKPKKGGGGGGGGAKKKKKKKERMHAPNKKNKKVCRCRGVLSCPNTKTEKGGGWKKGRAT
jgi:hypothetical protein